MHCLILGMTSSGKTTLAKKLILQARDRGIMSIVLDPLCDPGFGGDYQTDDPAEFLKIVWNSRSCLIVVDEGSESIGRYESPIIKLATKGRHWGHKCVFLSQRAMQINKTVRDQCTDLALFTSSSSDGKLLSDEFNSPELRNCSSLAKGHYYYTSRFSNVKKFKLF